MLNSTDILSFLLAFFVLALIISFLIKFQKGDLLKSKLKELASYKESLARDEEQEVKKVYAGFQSTNFPRLRAFIDKIQKSGHEEKESIQKLFLMAGFPAENSAFYYGVAKIGISLF